MAPKVQLPPEVAVASPGEMRDPMSPPAKTPLSSMAKLFRKTPGSQRLGIGPPVNEKGLLSRFWILLVITAILSSSLSFLIDRFTFAMGLLRSSLMGDDFLTVLGFDVFAACLARVIVRPTIEAEGSGFPEMKAMLFGKVLFNFLTLRVLVSKALALAVGVGAGLPLGKEGPNVHLAACIARVVDPKFFAKRVESSSSL
eukprot:s3970_g4.t1